MSFSRGLLLTISCVLGFGLTSLLAEEEKYLFNGMDLSQWDGKPGAWEVRHGEIWCTGTSDGKNWLIWKGDAPEDFTLRLEFRWEKGNSGVQVRSERLDDFQVRGYQVEVAQQDVMGLWHHSLVSQTGPEGKERSHLSTAGQAVRIAADGTKDVTQVEKPSEVQEVYDEEDWNEMEIIVKGPRLIQKINGVVFSDLTDEQDDWSRRDGVIALQDHGRGCIVAFRNLILVTE